MSGPRSLRLALFHDAFEAVGGAEVLVMTMATALRSLGHHVEILTFRYKPETWDGYRDRIPVRVLTWGISLVQQARMWKSRPWRGNLPVELIGVLAPYDGVIAHNSPCNALLGLTPTKGVKVWYCHEPDRDLHPSSACPNMTAALRTHAGFAGTETGRAMTRAQRGAQIKRWLLPSFRHGHAMDLAGVPRLDAVWANSHFTASRVQAIYARHAEVLYPAVPFPEQLAPRAPPDLLCLRILCQSRLTAFKGLETLVRGLASFLRRNPAGAVLHVVGQGSQQRFLHGIARSLDVQDHVRFHGFLPDDALGALRSRADLFALLPGDEPFGMVFPEAAAHGLLLIGSDHGGPGEMIEGGRFGFALDAFDPEAFARCLDHIRTLAPTDLVTLRERAFIHFRDACALQTYPARLQAAIDRLSPRSAQLTG